MTLKIWELISVILSAGVAGMFFGPWVALSRSLSTFEPESFLAIVDRMNRNMAAVMTILMPAALLSMVPVLWLTRVGRPTSFYLTLMAFCLFTVALLVTVIVEVPIVKQICEWTVPTLPENWRYLRDRWGNFHLARVAAGFAGFVVLAAAFIF